MTPNRVLLHLVHFLLTIYSVIHWFWNIFKKKAFVVSSKPVNSSIISNTTKSLTKLPIHIGFVVVEDELSYSDLAKIAFWCIVLGISNISIYDHKGKCKRNKEIFQEEFHRHKKRLSVNSSLGDTSVEINAGIRQHTTEITSRNQNHVHLLSVEDGRGELIEATRKISRAVKEYNMKLSDIHTASVDGILKDAAGFPDPDLVIRFGATESLFGFLPWHIRLTEFLSFPSHRHMDFQTFQQLLVCYSRTQQRFGK